MFDLIGRRVFVAGHRGMLGSALLRRLAGENCTVLTARRTVDLRDQEAVRAWFTRQKPDVVILAAARAGGIMAHHTAPAEFAYDNLMIAANVIEVARQVGSARLLFLASSACYPRETAQPMPESALLTGPLDSAHKGYAIAKLAGIALCQTYRRQYGCDFIAALPANLYGPGDKFDVETSHVVPSLVCKAHHAKITNASQLEIWGSGRPRRELLHVDDCADACIHLLRHYSDEAPINLGSGEDIEISELARLVCNAVGYDGPIVTDLEKPDGAMRKLMDISRLADLGWSPRIRLHEGLSSVYADFLAQLTDAT